MSIHHQNSSEFLNTKLAVISLTREIYGVHLAYGSLYLTDLQDQVVKTYKVGGEVTYRPLDLTLAGETSGRIDTAGRTAPAWLPGTDNTSRIRLIHRYPSIKGRFGMEYQSYDDFPQMNSGFLIYRMGE